MKNIYSFLIGATLLALWLPFSYDLTELPLYDLIRTEKPKPADHSLKKTRTYLSKSPLRVRREGMAALLAPAITATKTYTITNDTGLPGASANDELEYIIIISNAGNDDATGVSFTDQIDANTTLVNGSLQVSPIAQNDNYTTIGNVGITVSDGNGVLTNDINPGSGSLTITTASPITTTGGGTVTLNTTTGAFTYEPAVGYTGNDSFTYTLGNGSGLTATATVTITVSGKIWFVNNTATSSGTGTLASPFKQMSDFGTANTGATGKPADNDFIFVYTGSGDYTGTATLRTGQKLIGQGASVSLLTITGYAAPSGTSAIPATGGANPVLTTTVTGTNALNVGSGNTLRGFTIGNTTGSKIAGTNFGTLTATEVTLDGNGQALNLTTGALAATFTSISSTSSAAAGISLSGVTGNLTSTNGTTITNPTAQGIAVNTASGGTFNFGATSLTGSGGAGLSSTGFANTLQFSSLTIDAAAGQKAIDISGATGTLNATSGVISDNISIAGSSSANRITLGTTFTSISSTNSTTTGISLSNVAGNLTSGTTTITNPSSQGISVSGTASTGTLNFGTTSLTGSGGAGLSSNGFANTLQFTSLVITPDAGQKGIDVTGGTGTLNIQTGTITTSNNSALSIAGVSSVSKVTLGVILTSVSANGSSGTTTKGISLNNTSGSFLITGTGSTDGSGGTIQNITQRGAEFINATGITLKNINFISANTSNGCSPLTSPTPFAGCYGSVYLESVTNATLDNININSTDGTNSSGSNAQRGITGTGVTGLTISNTVVKNAGDEVKEGAIFLQSLAGTVNFTNLNLLNNPGADDLLRIENYSTSPTITVDGSTFSNTQNSLNGSYGMIVSNYGNGNTNVTVKNSTFDRIRTQGVKGISEGTGTLNYNITNNSFDPQAGIGSAIELTSNESGQLNFNILNNPTAKARGTSVINVVSQGSSTAQGRINGNTVTHVGGAGDTGSGIRVFAEESSTLKVEVNNNTISGVYEEFGILARSRNGSGRLDAIITNNTVMLPSGNDGFGTNIGVDAGTSNSTFTNVTCGYVANNVTNTPGIFGQNFVARQASGSHTLYLQSGTNAATVWNANGNTPVSPPAVIGQSGTIISGTCQTPNNPLPGARMMADAELEQNQAAAGESVIPLLADSDNSTILPATPAELVTPVVEEEKPVAEPAPLPIAEKTVTTATSNKSAREAATQAGETVTVNGSGSGFTLPPSTSVTIKFRVTINSNIPNSTCQVSNQGTVSAAGLSNVLTDDPAVSGGANPTVTPLQSAPVITTAQTAITAAADPATCTASRSFAVAVAGCPTPTVTYKIGATPITSPHAFPVGQTTVDVTVSNGNAPDATSSFTVTVSPAPAPVIEAAGQPQNQTITVGGNASFSVVAQGTGLTYQWQKKVGAGAFTDIPAAGNASATTATLNLTAPPISESGTQYRVVVSNQCTTSTTSDPATLTVNPLISATIEGNASVCLNEATQPLITFTGADGTAPYTFTYKINNGSNVEITTTSGNSVTVAQPTGTAGSFVYTLLNVKDAADVSLAQNSTATITVNAIVFGQPTVNNVSCNAGINGSIGIIATGGTSPYTYTLSPGNVQNTTGSFTGLAANTYSISVTDANGCQATVSDISLGEPTAIAFGLPTVTNVSCNGGTNGSVAITATGGTGAFTYTLSPGNVQNNTGSFTGLAAGNAYSVTATDANSCTKTSATITVSEPSAITFGQPTVVNVLCNGGTNGSIAIIATGGTGAFTYTLSPGNVQNNTGSFTGLAAGNYTVTATDANSCTKTSATITISEPSAITFGQPTVVNVLCNGGTNGSIAIIATGGTGAFTYTLSPGNVQNNTGSFTGLAAGNTYAVTATDANSCTKTSATITVSEPSAITFDQPTVVNVLCNGGTNGSIAITATGGTGAFTYTLSPGNVQNNTGSFTGLAAGNTYSVTATDANNCTKTSATITVSEPSAITFGQPTVVNVLCNGGTNGSIAITATGGTGAFTYTLSPGNVQNNTGSFTGLAVGNTYTVTATDANNCTKTSSTITVTQPAAIGLGAPTVTNVSCNGGTNGSIAITATGGTGAFTYTLSPGNVQNNTGSFTGLAAGNAYSVSVTDANNCPAANSGSITVTQPAAISLGAPTVVNVLCNGGTNGSIAISATGGTGAFTYTLSPGNVQNTTGSFTGLAAGNYTVTATDANSCTKTSATITVSEPSAITFGQPTVVNVLCNGGTNGSIAITATGGTGAFTYTLSPGNVQNNTGSFTGLAAGNYTVTATDDNNCSVTTGTISVTQPTAALSVSVSGNTSVTFGFGSNCTTLTANASGGTGSYGYSWNNGANPVNAAITQVCPGPSSQTYTVTVTDANQCTASKMVTVTVNDVRCGPQKQNVTICYYGITQCVSEKIAERYLKLGATLGGCGSSAIRTGYEESTSEPALSLSVRAYPNPTTGRVMVEVQSPEAGTATFEVLNAMGRTVQQKTQELAEGLNEVPFELVTQPAGNYLIRCRDSLGRQAVVRINKQ
jgi:hypothetical protein